MITTRQPESWQALQQESARVLRECGFSVEVERKLPIARGQAEIDVYAKELVKGREHVVLCECKHWKARVPQSVVHSFRTLVADAGANAGYIISSSGFQSGAREAAKLTNIRLVTWPEFQQEFEENWLENYLVPTVTEQFDTLITYAEPLLADEFRELPETDLERILSLKRSHDLFGVLMMRFTKWARMLDHEFPRLPLRQSLEEKDLSPYVPADVLNAEGYREFLEAAIAHRDKVLAAFHSVLRRVAP